MGVGVQDLLQLAESLVADPRDEIAWRAAASRAYYAGHHACDTACTRHGVPPATSGWTRPHKMIIRELLGIRIANAAGEAKLRQAGRLLNQILDMRTIADYEINGTFTSNQAQQAIALAKQVLALA